MEHCFRLKVNIFLCEIKSHNYQKIHIQLQDFTSQSYERRNLTNNSEVESGIHYHYIKFNNTLPFKSPGSVRFLLSLFFNRNKLFYSSRTH